ncbi:MAG: hypothetical protein AAFR74_05035 [Pseudomonadota bacterium]
MRFEELELKSLVVNKENDRHGEVLNEQAAIHWLLEHRSQHMRNLAKDVVEVGEIYEPPLVHKVGRSFVVFDGNRRTTTLKLLQNPDLAPSIVWSEFYKDLREQWKGDFPTKITCQIEDDRERLDEILYRRHTGQKNGVGQSRWDSSAKTFFERRTGKNTKLDIAETVEQILHDGGHLDKEKNIPRSTFKRLLSAEQFRNRAGVSIQNNSLVFTHKKEASIAALSRIAHNLIDKEVTLDDVWDNAAKRRYLDRLEKEGVLPTVNDIQMMNAQSPQNQANRSLELSQKRLDPVLNDGT